MALATSLPIEGIQNGKPSGQRIKSAVECASLVGDLVYANEKRVQANTLVRAVLDGNPPFNPQLLQAEGQSYRCNVNFREAEGIHLAALSPYYDLFAESPYYAEIQTSEGNTYERNEWSKVITQEWCQMLKDWDGFDYHAQLAITDMVDYGRGFVMWPDHANWQFEAIKDSRVLVPDGTPAHIDQLETLVIRKNWLMHELWGAVKNRTAAESAGWNVAATVRAMSRAAPEYFNNTTTDDYEYFQRQIRNNDIYMSFQSKTVKAAHVYVKEFGGKVTHYLVEETGSQGRSEISQGNVYTKTLNSDNSEQKVEYLFAKQNRFGSFRQALGAMFYDIGDGTWHSIKGLLVKMYPFIQIKNRAMCALVDNLFLNMSVLLRPLSSSATQNTSLMQVGPLSILPPNYEVTQWGLAGRMDEGVAMDRHLDNKLSANTGMYRTGVRREQGNPETATQVLADQSKEATLNKSAVNRFYAQWDFIYEEMYRRTVEHREGTAKDFIDRCLKRGVPEKAIKKVKSVRAYRNIGLGSIFMRQQAFRESAALVPMMNEQGRSNWLDDAIASITNQDMVDRYNPKPMELMPGVMDERNHATLENAAMKEGVLPPISPTQNHVVHADTHLTAAGQALQSLPQGGNPMAVLAFMEQLGPHVAAHLGQFQNDQTRGRAFKALTEKFKEIAGVTQKLRQQVKQMGQQRQQLAMQNRQMLSDEQLKEAKTQSDISRKERKTALDMQLKSAKTRQTMALKDAETAVDINLKRSREAANDTD